MNDYKDLIERDEWLADKIPAFGDFGKDCARYLRKSAEAIKSLIAERDEEIASHKATNIMLDRLADELAALKQKIASAEPVVSECKYPESKTSIDDMCRIIEFFNLRKIKYTDCTILYEVTFDQLRTIYNLGKDHAPMQVCCSDVDVIGREYECLHTPKGIKE